MSKHVRRFLDGTTLSIKGLDRDDLPPSTATQVFIAPGGVEAEFVRTTAAAAADIAPTFGYNPTEEVLLVNGLTVRYGPPYGDPKHGIGFSLTAAGGDSTVSSWVPESVSAATLLQWLAAFVWSVDNGELNVHPGDETAVSTRWRPRIDQVVPDAGLLTIELTGPASATPSGAGKNVPGGLLYRRTVQGQVAYLILDGGDVLTKMMPFPDTAAAPDDLVAEASQLVVHRG